MKPQNTILLVILLACATGAIVATAALQQVFHDAPMSPVVVHGSGTVTVPVRRMGWYDKLDMPSGLDAILFHVDGVEYVAVSKRGPYGDIAVIRHERPAKKKLSEIGEMIKRANGIDILEGNP